MSNSKRLCLGLVLAIGLATAPSGALGAPTEMTTLEHLNAHAMLETLTTGYWSIQQEYGLDPTSSVAWSGTYSETGWTAGIDGTLYGTPVIVNYTGTSAVQPDSSVRLTYQGAGSIDTTQTVTVTGTGVWGFDGATGLYTSLYLEDQGVVDTPKLKWWAKALEAIGGGVVGGLAGGWGGVLEGAQAGIALSGAVFGGTIDNTDPPDPGVPALPAVADWDATLTYVPDGDEIISRIFGTGDLNANVRNQVILTGTWNGGLASGTALTVPEPMTLSVLAAGAGGILLRRRRRNARGA